MSHVIVRGAARITGIAPRFLVDDLDRAITYYRDRLGFRLDLYILCFSEQSASI